MRVSATLIKMTLCCLLLIGVQIPISTAQENWIVKGFVLDSLLNTPLPYPAILFDGNKDVFWRKHVLADSLGKFELQIPGQQVTVRLTASYLGYKVTEKQIIPAWQNEEIEIKLVKLDEKFFEHAIKVSSLACC